MQHPFFIHPLPFPGIIILFLLQKNNQKLRFR